MDVKQAIYSRYSVREYDSKKVPRELIQTLLDAALQAPSSCNLQLMHYVVVDDPALQKKLSEVATTKVLWAPVNIFFFIDPRFTKKRHSSIMGLGAAMQNISLTAIAHGLATCPIAGFAGDAKIKKILGVPDVLESILIMSVGYATETQKPRTRIEAYKTMHFNVFNQASRLLLDSRKIDLWSVEDIINYRSRIAPVYRYGNRFRLHTYVDSIYNEIAEKTQRLLDKDGLAVLDLFTYDGMFCKELIKRNQHIKMTISDYDAYTLEINKNIKDTICTTLIGEKNNILASDNSQDVVTIIHKLQFTPQKQMLFNEIVRVLKVDGKLVVTVDQNEWFKMLYIKLREAARIIIYRETNNVYENSPYYKIGPYSYILARNVDQLATRAGLKKVSSSYYSITQSGRINHKLYYAVYKK